MAVARTPETLQDALGNLKQLMGDDSDSAAPLPGPVRGPEKVAEQARRHFGDRVFETELPRLVAIAEAPLEGAPIVIAKSPNKSNPGSAAYWELAKEASDRIDRILGTKSEEP